jgi:hypothetical protein
MFQNSNISFKKIEGDKKRNAEPEAPPNKGVQECIEKWKEITIL